MFELKLLGEASTAEPDTLSWVDFGPRAQIRQVRQLIERLRLQHHAWRTERTYGDWAWRLAEFIHPRDRETATDEDWQEEDI